MPEALDEPDEDLELLVDELAELEELEVVDELVELDAVFCVSAPAPACQPMAMMAAEPAPARNAAPDRIRNRTFLREFVLV